VINFQISITQACKHLSIAKSTYYYKSKPKDDSYVIEAINRVIDKHPQDGFWLISNRLKKQGFKANHKKIYRVYKLLGLNIQRRAKKRIPARVKEPLQELYTPNEQWSMDFMSDKLYSGKRYRILNVMDEFNRELIEFEVGVNLPSSKVIQTLQRAIDIRGKPKSIRVDNGPEFISRKLEIWCYIKGIKLKFIQPGKPTQNSRVERFNGTMRREFFNAYIFDTLAEVKLMVKDWVNDYNHNRPHSVLGKLSPIEYLDKYNLKQNYYV
jgi:putative transposase